MTRIKINARRIFSLLIPFFFFTSVHAEQTAAPAKPVTVEAKNETFAPQHPDQYLSWKATSEQSERVDALAEDPRLVILWAGYPFSRDYNKPRGHAFAVTDVRETLRTGAPKNAEDGPLPMACWSCKSPDVARLLATKGITHEIQIPDISTKEKAQQAIGLNMEQIKAEKQDFIKTVIPQWEEQARKNGLLSQ
ncbi:hypothetical protein DLW27_10420 [Escherichia coli]|nr:hypothetical protein [Escherichia coli]